MNRTYPAGEVLIPLDKIVPNPNNPRYEAGDVTELRASIIENGLLQPLLIQPAREDGKHVLEDGFRRWTAMRHTPFKVAPCRIAVIPADEDPARHALVVAVVADVHRKDLNPIERAQALGRLRDEYGMSQKEIAKAVGIGVAAVSYTLTLLELDDPSQQRVISGRVTVADAITAIRKQRAKNRRRQGHKPVNILWEPPHFTEKHFLAKKARTMCNARQHTQRRRIRGIACEQCWETAIRQDQELVTRTELQEAMPGVKVPFQPPIMVSHSESDSMHNGGIDAAKSR